MFTIKRTYLLLPLVVLVCVALQAHRHLPEVKRFDLTITNTAIADTVTCAIMGDISNLNRWKPYTDVVVRLDLDRAYYYATPDTAGHFEFIGLPAGKAKLMVVKNDVRYKVKQPVTLKGSGWYVWANLSPVYKK